MKSSVRSIWRQWRRRPGVSVAVFLTVALSVGASATLLAITARLFLSPPSGVHDADAVFRLWFSNAPANQGLEVGSDRMSFPAYVTLRGAMQSTVDLAAYTSDRASVGRGSSAQEMGVGYITGPFLAVLGIRPTTGRMWSESEAESVAPALISHRLWTQRPASTIEVDGVTHTVLGVLPDGFEGIDATPVDVWLPVDDAGKRDIGPDWSLTADAYWIQVIGRLRHLEWASRATAEATTILQHAQPNPLQPNDPVRALLAPLLLDRGPMRSRASRIALWLTFASLLLFLVACLSVMTIFAAEGLDSRREIAVRRALGGGSLGVTFTTAIGPLALLALGGLAGLCLMTVGAPWLFTALMGDTSMPLRGSSSAAFGIATLLVLLLLAASLAAIAFQVTKTAPAVWLAGGWAAARRRRSLGLLIATQAALAMLLSCALDVCVQSLRNIRATPTGADDASVMVVHAIEGREDTDTIRLDALYTNAARTAELIPGVRNVAVATAAPGLNAYSTPISASSPTLPANPRGHQGASINAVSDGFFGALGIAVVRGRDFTATESREGAHLVIVNQTLAKRLWPGKDPLDQCVRLGSDSTCRSVIAVVNDLQRALMSQRSEPQMYVPLASRLPSMTSRYLFVTTDGQPERYERSIRRVVLGIQGDLLYIQMIPLSELLEPYRRAFDVAVLILTLFAAFALAIAGVAMYGIVAHSSSQRRQEIAIRLAFGAIRRDAFILLLKHSVWSGVAGICAGAALSLAVIRVASSLLFHVGSMSPVALMLAAVVIFVSTTVAGASAAVRVAFLQPSEELRYH